MNKPTPASLRYWLVAYVAELIGVRPDRIDLGRSLWDYGLDGPTSGELAERLEDVLRRPVAPQGLLADTSIADLADDLADGPLAPQRISLTVEALDELVAQLSA